MSTNSIRLKPRTMSNLGMITRVAMFLGILLVSGLIIPFSYMVSNVVFFVALLAFIVFGFKNFQGRNLLLLLYAHLLVFVSAINVAVMVPAIRQFAANSFPSEPLAGAILISMLIALVVTVLVVTIPFLLIVALLSIVVLNWHKGEGATFLQVFDYVLRSILGLPTFWVVIEGGEKKGAEDDIERLDMFGGPGWLIVYPRYVVVLHRHGKTTRAVGPGPVPLKRAEKIKAILPLDKSGNVQIIENVLTRDRIPLTITMLHVAQLESAAETKARYQKELDEAKAHQDELRKDTNASADDKAAAKEAVEKAEKRLKSLENDAIIDDEFDTCYESVAKVAATKAKEADVWGMFKTGIAINLKDVMMSVYAEELFSIDEGDNKLELKEKISQRKIAEIEQILTNKVKDSKLNDGAKLIVLDILQIEFPKELQKKINEEVETHIEARIQKTKAQIEESKAKGSLVAARARAEAKKLQGQSEGEARAAEFRTLLNELKQDGSLKDDELAKEILKLISTMTTVKEMESLYKFTLGNQPHRYAAPDDANGKQTK